MARRMSAMERIRKYLGLTVNLENIKDAEGLKALGFTCRYLPDPPEDFDEFEFVTDLEEIDNLGLMVAVELMTIKRIFFGLISPEDPDAFTALSDTQLRNLLTRHGQTLIRFFDYITQ
jgi:hypothetical protein